MKRRFKTEQEFRDEFGKNWRNYIVHGWTGSMDILFGQPEDHPEAEIWSISEDMLTDKLLPSQKELILLEEAKRRYPIGTKFRIAHIPNEIRIVKSHKDHKDIFIFNNEALHINLLVEKNKEGLDAGSVYANGQWAEIVSLPEQKTQQIEVGDLVECFDSGNSYMGSGWKKHRQFIVNKIDYLSTTPVAWEKGNGFGICFGVYTHSLKIIKKKVELESEEYLKSKKSSWEPSNDTCKRCALTFFDGPVNTNQWNLCEGKHCADMEEEEALENEINNLTQNKNEKSENIISKKKSKQSTSGKSKQGNCIKIQRSNSSISTGHRRTGTSISRRG